MPVVNNRAFAHIWTLKTGRRLLRALWVWSARAICIALSVAVINGLWRITKREDRMGGREFIEHAIVIAVAVGLTVGLVIAFIKSKPDALVEDSAAMPIQARRLLAWYLLLLGVVLVYV